MSNYDKNGKWIADQFELPNMPPKVDVPADNKCALDEHKCIHGADSKTQQQQPTTKGT